MLFGSSRVKAMNEETSPSIGFLEQVEAWNYEYWWFQIPSGKLTWPWKIPIFPIVDPIKMVDFLYCYVYLTGVYVFFTPKNVEDLIQFLRL